MWVQKLLASPVRGELTQLFMKTEKIIKDSFPDVIVTMQFFTRKKSVLCGVDEAIALIKPTVFSLEEALEFIQDDELVEVTPSAIRLRKKILDPNERFKINRK